MLENSGAGGLTNSCLTYYHKSESNIYNLVELEDFGGNGSRVPQFHFFDDLLRPLVQLLVNGFLDADSRE